MIKWRSLILLLSVAVVGCSSESISLVANTKMEGWQRAAIFDITNSDTLQSCDISLFLRYNIDIVEESIRLNIVTTTPSELTIAEQINIALQGVGEGAERAERTEGAEGAVRTEGAEREEGQERVEGERVNKRGDIRLLEIPYRNGVKWREEGCYKVAIYPTKPTDGVEAVGVTLR